MHIVVGVAVSRAATVVARCRVWYAMVCALDRVCEVGRKYTDKITGAHREKNCT